MRPTLDPEAPKLCNNCLIREEKRNPKTKDFMENTIDIKITIPCDLYNEIEEHCINAGIDTNKYFINLHMHSILSKFKDEAPEVGRKTEIKNIPETEESYGVNKPMNNKNKVNRKSV